MTSNAEESLATLLRWEKLDAGMVREFRFAPPRRWRFDFAWKSWEEDIGGGWSTHHPAVAIEVEGGSFTGGHKRGRAYESDCEKQNQAMLLGWRVFRVTPAMVEDGRAIALIRQALGMERAA